MSVFFTAHNIALPDGSQTRPGAGLIADSSVCRVALQDLALAFPDRTASPRVADLGCLEGGYAVEFARAGYDVTGIEVRTENIECCQYVADRVKLPNLRFIQADVRDVFAYPVWYDAVFCCGLLYHLDSPVAFLGQLGKAVRRLLIVDTHFSTRPDSEHEGRRGHWYDESPGRWSSWGNERAFWLAPDDLLAAMRDAGFDEVFEQAGCRRMADDRSMFAAVKRSAP